jgi:hypothetical protein
MSEKLHNCARRSASVGGPGAAYACSSCYGRGAPAARPCDGAGPSEASARRARTWAAGIVSCDSQCMRINDDGRGAMCSRARASEMRRRLSWDRPSDWEPGAAVRRRARHGGQTSRAPVPRRSDHGLGVEGAEASLDARSRTRRRGCGEVGLRYPVWHGGQAIQAPDSRRSRPGRAFYVPLLSLVTASGRAPGRPAPPPSAAGRHPMFIPIHSHNLYYGKKTTYFLDIPVC